MSKNFGDQRRMVQAEVRFDFAIPIAIQGNKEAVDDYAWEKIKLICKKLSRSQELKVVPIVPPKYR